MKLMSELEQPSIVDLPVEFADGSMFPMTCAAAEDDHIHLEVTSHERVEIAE
jgi:hypothetical protein